MGGVSLGHEITPTGMQMFAPALFRWTDPTAWPWPFDVWLAFLVGGWLIPGLWRWFERRRATGWPLADGRIESTELAQPNFALTTRRRSHVARLRYSYSVFGNAYFGSEGRARFNFIHSTTVGERRMLENPPGRWKEGLDIAGSPTGSPQSDGRSRRCLMALVETE
jgi:hypothetical protein